MNEESFTTRLFNELNAYDFPCNIGLKKPLLYSLAINENGEIDKGLDQEGKPIRGKGTGFEQDLLFYEEVNGEVTFIPRVSLEIKYNNVTTHNTLVYSEKARRIKSIYPYLRYGFILGGEDTIAPRVLRLGEYFDFIVAIPDSNIEKRIDELAQLILQEIETSKQLARLFNGKQKIDAFHQSIVASLSPTYDIISIKNDSKSDMYISVINRTIEKNKRNDIRYYVYENWVAENKARIHFGYCRCCNYGEGIHNSTNEKNGKWHGPFNTLEIAKKVATETGREVSKCKICNPA